MQRFRFQAIRSLLTALLLGSMLFVLPVRGADTDPLSWPAITRETRPWTRWWWLGSAVDKPNLTRLLEDYHQAGIGGVEICSIYGAHGYEDRFIQFLSPQWMQMLGHTTAEAARLDMGVDTTTGTGWPFGGPNVSADDASAQVILNKSPEFAANSPVTYKAPAGRLQCLIAVLANGEQINVTSKVTGGSLQWTSPASTGHLYAVLARGPVQKVKRAAPGGEGNVLDPFSPAKLATYLSRFDQAYAGYTGAKPRSQFHDSYEYYNASWTDELFDAFQKSRGYDLRTQLPAFFGEGPQEIVARVKCDYRETISDLHLAYVRAWTQWSHDHGSLSRNQAHGGPGNLIDTYAASDIPETEVFAKYEERHLPMLKFSSSAAHLKGTRLASSESFTWAGEHFQVSLAQLKPEADFLLLSGVNHILFHGIPYSPADAPWPGFQFYAAVNFGPTGGLWRDLPTFNAYIARCQSILQAGRPSNDVLLYTPFFDIWQNPQGVLTQFTTPGTWMFNEPFHATAVKLWSRGYGYDEISDRFLADAKAVDGAVVVGGNTYRTVLVPKVRVMPVATLKQLIDLASGGATIVFQDSLPGDVPGFADLEKRRGEFKDLIASIKFEDAGSGIRKATVGRGKILLGTEVDSILAGAGLTREAMTDSGLRFVRRTHEHGFNYFLVNWSDHAIDGWIPLGTNAKSAALLDPMFSQRTGAAKIKQSADGATQVYLQFRPHESLILRTFADVQPIEHAWDYAKPAGQSIAVAGPWKVQFVDGGPEIPKAYETTVLTSWTTRDDPELKRFAGTAKYLAEFERPVGQASDWVLDLGSVHESARVRVNGHDVGTLILPPFQLAIGKFLQPGRNTLEIEVTNLAANRIADMDRRKVKWKYFYDANLASQIQRNGLDASQWPLRDSGLVGPVSLQPVERLEIQ